MIFDTLHSQQFAVEGAPEDGYEVGIMHQSGFVTATSKQSLQGASHCFSCHARVRRSKASASTRRPRRLNQAQLPEKQLQHPRISTCPNSTSSMQPHHVPEGGNQLRLLLRKSAY